MMICYHYYVEFEIGEMCGEIPQRFMIIILLFGGCPVKPLSR